MSESIYANIHYFEDDRILHSHRHENLKSYMPYFTQWSTMKLTVAEIRGGFSEFTFGGTASFCFTIPDHSCHSQC
jgi:hypothetical protein